MSDPSATGKAPDRRGTEGEDAADRALAEAAASSGEPPLGLNGIDESGAPIANGEVRTAYISGNTFAGVPVLYSAINGLAILEGDIVLGTVAEVEAEASFQRMNAGRANPLLNNVVPENDNRWPGGVVPFVIDDGLPDQDRVTDGIAHWKESSGIRLVARTTERDYIRFVVSDACNSPIGRQGGEQRINLADGCRRGQVIHEIFHALGAYHEQSRDDASSFISVIWNNVKPGMEHNFQEHPGNNIDIGAYDFGSIMHYAADAFSVNGRDTIETIPPGAAIGQRDALSALDLAAVGAMYPGLGQPAAKPKEPEADVDTTNKELYKDLTDDPPKDPKEDILKDNGEKESWDDHVKILKSWEGEYGEGYMFPDQDAGVPAGAKTSRGGAGGMPRTPFVLGTGRAVAPDAARSARVGDTRQEVLTRMHQSLVAFTRLRGEGMMSGAEARAWLAIAEAYTEVVRSITGFTIPQDPESGGSPEPTGSPAPPVASSAGGQPVGA